MLLNILENIFSCSYILLDLIQGVHWELEIVIMLIMSLKNVFLCCKYDFLSAFTGRFCFMLSDVEKIAFNVLLSLYVSGFHYFRFWVHNGWAVQV